MHRYYFKIFIFAAGLMLLAFLILAGVFAGVGRGLILRERQNAIEGDVVELSRLASAYTQGGSLEDWDFRFLLSAIAQSTGNHCFVTGTNGVVVTCSDTELICEHIGKTPGEPAVSALRERGYFTAATDLGGFYAEKRYVAALPVVSPTGAVTAYIFAASSISDVMQSWNILLRTFRITAVSVMLVLVLVCYIAARIGSRPLTEMAEASVKLARGDFSARVSGDGRTDELGALAASFNRMAESLERSEKRRSDFIANVAHEMKTPMTSIAGFADGILDGTIPKDQADRYLETISSETKRLNRLVRSMLDLSRMQNAGPEELRQRSFDAADLLGRTLVVFESRINAKRLEVNAMIPEDPMLVRGDADAINQVVYNLLENAVKFSEEGGELDVGLFKHGEKAYISVKNRGPTIPEEELPLIFDRFHKTDKSRAADREGYGLGLYIVKTILINHGEDIAVTSRDGVTEFVFSLSLKQK